MAEAQIAKVEKKLHSDAEKSAVKRSWFQTHRERMEEKGEEMR